MGCVRAPILARAREGDALLVAGELDELAQFLLREHLQSPPEKLDMLVCLHQPHLVHGVGLGKRGAGVSWPGPALGKVGMGLHVDQCTGQLW